MSGERDLDKLQRHLAPTLHPATFVYCNFPDFRLPPGLEPICTFREVEGLTAIAGSLDHLLKFWTLVVHG